MKTTIVFYIDEDSIKFLQASGVQKKTVTAMDIVAINGLDDARIIERLAALSKQHKLNFRGAEVIVLIPRMNAILRHLTLPSHDQEELRSMIDLQIVNTIPYAREDVELDFQVLSKNSDGYSKVMAVIVPEEKAMRYWKLFAGARIPVTRMTLSSVGLWLLYQQQPELPAWASGIIDLDENHSEICLCRKDFWLTSREIPIGLAQMRNDDLEEFLRHWRLTCNSLAVEKNLEQPVRSVYLLSWTAQAQPLAAALGGGPNCTVAEIDLIKRLPVSKNIVWSQAVKEKALRLAALAGVAISGQTPPVNLIPRSLTRQEQQKSSRRDLVTTGAWAAVAVIMVGLASSANIFKERVQLKRLQEQWEQLKPQADKTQRRLKQVHEMEQALAARPVFAEWAGELYRLLPPEVVLSGFSLADGNRVSLEGMSVESGDINQLQRTLADSGVFTNVNLDYVNRRVGEDNQTFNYFKISCVVKGTDEKTQ